MPAGCRLAFRLLLTCLASGLVLTSGCGKHKPEQAKDAIVEQMSAYGGPEAAKLRAGGKAADKPQALPGSVRGTGWHIPWYTANPKNPKAPSQRLLIADAKQGALDNSGDVAVLHLGEVVATLYHDGKPSATLTAPHVTINERDRVLIATGGVTIHSLLDPASATQGKIQPADTTVTADKVVWDSHQTNVVCTGNAHFARTAPNAPDIVNNAQRILYNTETGHFRSEFAPQ